MSNLHIIGVDPAASKPNVIAHLPGDSSPAWVIRVKPGRMDLFRHALVDGVLLGNAVLVLEGGYIGKNPATGLKLERMRGRILQVADELCIPSYVVSPAKWQTDLITGGCRGVRRKQLEPLIAMVGHRIAKERRVDTSKKLTQDDLSALCIADWGAKQYESYRVEIEKQDKEFSSWT